MIIDLHNTGQTHAELYKLYISAVTPRPIAFVSTVSADGARNLAPFSFFNMVSANPPVMIFCPSRTRDGAKKDTRVNVEQTGEFVVNIVTEQMAERMHQASAAYAHGVDEFAKVGFTPAPSVKVKPPRVAESPAAFECTLDQIIDFGEHPGAGCVVFGRVVAVNIDESYLADDGAFDPDKLRTIGRMGRGTYARTTDRFDLPPARVE